MVIAHNICSLGLNLALTTALRGVAERPPGRPRLILWHHDLAWMMPGYRDSLHDGHPWTSAPTWPGAAQVVVSAARQDELAGLFGMAPGEIPIIPNGVDLPDTWRLGRRTLGLARADRILEASPLLLMPARITPRKNVELACGWSQPSGRRAAGPGWS